MGRKESVKIAVLSASRHKNCTLKDVAGGFGTVFTVGKSPFARLLELAKRRIAAIPNITLAYLDSILSAYSASVKVLDVRSPDQLVPADLYLISSSIVDCNLERELGIEARRRFGAKVGYFGSFAATVPEFFLDSADFIVKGEIENIAPHWRTEKSRKGPSKPDSSTTSMHSLSLDGTSLRYGASVTRLSPARGSRSPCWEAADVRTRATTVRTW